MAYKYGSPEATASQAPPVVAELEAIFRELPDEELLESLRPNPRGMGRPGYAPKVLWRCYVALYYLGLPSVSDLVRTLQDNPFISRACGIANPWEIPHQSTFSRFLSKLAKPVFAHAVKRVLWALTDRLIQTLPDFGKSVAVDSTDIKAWSNAAKKGKKRRRPKGEPRRYKPRRGMVSDPDAGWIVKSNTEGNKKYVWGYKVHILCDTTYELPIVVDVTKGNVHDSRRATPLLRQARYATQHFWPRYFLADAAYSSERIRAHIKHNYPRCEPIIDPNPHHKKAMAKTPKTPEWKMLYKRRTAVERLNGRLKAHRRLNSVRTRGRFKVTLHALLSVIACQAHALATDSRQSVRRVA